MRIFFLITALNITFIAFAWGANNAIIASPYLTGRDAGSFVATKDYEDVRVFEQKSKKLKYWKIRAKKITIEQYYANNKVVEVIATETRAKSMIEVRYVKVLGKLRLVRAKHRPLRVMAGELIRDDLKANACKVQSSLLSEIADLSNKMDVGTCEANVENQLIDPKCKEVFGEDEFKLLKEAYAINLVLPEDQNTILNCLATPANQKILGKACGITDSDDLESQINIIRKNYEVTATQISKAPEQIKNKVSCAVVNDGLTRAETREDGTTIYLKSTAPGQTPATRESWERLVAHESVHVAGVKGENIAENIVNICFNRASEVKCEAATILKAENTIVGDNGKAPAITSISRLDEENQEIANNTRIKTVGNDVSEKLPKLLPESAFPSADVITKASLDSAQDYRSTNARGGDASDYAQLAYQSSRALAERPLSTAKTLFNLASSSIPVANAASFSAKPSENRAPASDALVAAAASVSQNSRNKNSANLSDRDAATTVDSSSGVGAYETATAAKARKTANGELSLGSDAGSGTVSTIRSGARSGSLGGSGGTGPVGGSGGTGPVGGSSSGRMPASVRAASSEQLKIAQIIEKSPYDVTQSRLARQEFIRQLKANKITIVKMDGSAPVGADKGDIVYLDKGSERKFVRQK